MIYLLVFNCKYLPVTFICTTDFISDLRNCEKSCKYRHALSDKLFVTCRYYHQLIIMSLKLQINDVFSLQTVALSFEILTLIRCMTSTLVCLFGSTVIQHFSICYNSASNLSSAD